MLCKYKTDIHVQLEGYYKAMKMSEPAQPPQGQELSTVCHDQPGDTCLMLQQAPFPASEEM